MEDTTVILDADADDLLGDLSKVDLALDETTVNAQEFAHAMHEYDTAMDDADAATEAHQDSLRALLEVEDEVEDAVEAVVDAVQQEAAVVSVAANDFVEYAQAVEESTTTTEDLGEETEKSRGILARMGDTAKSVGGFIANMFVIDITRIPKLLEKIGKKLFGGSEEFEQLQAQLDGMLHTIGGALLPVLEGIGKGFEVVREVVTKLAPAIRGIASRFASFASGVMDSVIGMVVPAFEMIIEFATELAAQVTVSFTWIAAQATLLWEGIVLVFDHIAELFGHTQGFAQMLADGIKTSWDAVSETTSVAWAFVQTVIENFQLAASAAITKFALTTITVFEEIKHFFSEVIPASVSWFAEQFIATLGDIGSFLGSVLENWKENFGNFFESVWSWLTGDGFDFRFTALEEGFEKTMIELPEIAARQKSALEQSLASVSETLSTSFSDKLSQRLNENQAALDAARNSIRDSLDMEGAVPGLTFPPEIEVKEPEKSGENDDKDTDGGELKTNKDLDKDKEETGLKGASGLAELASGIQDALFNRADPTTDAIKDGTQKSVIALEKIAEGNKDVRKAVENLDTRARYAGK